jgi:hypothetical protein
LGGELADHRLGEDPGAEKRDLDCRGEGQLGEKLEVGQGRVNRC